MLPRSSMTSWISLRSALLARLRALPQFGSVRTSLSADAAFHRFAVSSWNSLTSSTAVVA